MGLEKGGLFGGGVRFLDENGGNWEMGMRKG